MKDAKPENLKPAFDAAFSMLGAYEKTTVAPGPENQLEKIAGGAGKESVPVDTTVYAMLMRALQLNDMTGRHLIYVTDHCLTHGWRAANP